MSERSERLRSRRAAGVAASLLLAGAAAATTVQKLDFAGLTRLSTNVVVGRVGASETAWTPDGGTVVTLTSVEVASQWKGSIGAATAVVVRTPGGRIGDYLAEVTGTPSLRAGETALLFLERNPDGTYGVISLAQGSFRVAANRDGELRVTRDPNAAHLVAVSGRESGPVDAVDASLLAVEREVGTAARAPEAEEESPENLVPVSDVKGGGR